MGIKCQGKLTGGEKAPGRNIIVEISIVKVSGKTFFSSTRYSSQK